MRINKKQFRKAIITILFTILAIVLINIFCNNLVDNGFDSLFTTRVYKNVFKNSEYDLMLIGILRWTFTLVSITACYFQLDAERQLAEIDRMERILLREEGQAC